MNFNLEKINSRKKYKNEKKNYTFFIFKKCRNLNKIYRENNLGYLKLELNWLSHY